MNDCCVQGHGQETKNRRRKAQNDNSTDDVSDFMTYFLYVWLLIAHRAQVRYHPSCAYHNPHIRRRCRVSIPQLIDKRHGITHHVESKGPAVVWRFIVG